MNGTAPPSARLGSTLALRAWAWSAWSLWLIAVVAGLLGLVLGIREQATGRSVIPQSAASYAAGTVLSIAFASVGLVLRLRLPGLVIGWLFLGIGLVAGLANMSWEYVLLGAAAGADPGPIATAQVAWFANGVQASAWFALAVSLVLLFPDGHVVGRIWGWVLTGVIVTAGLLAVCLAVAPGPLQFFPFVANPYPAGGAIGDLAVVGAAVLLLIMTIESVAAAWSMVLRYRRGTTVERQQLKWFAWAAALAIAAGLVEMVMAGGWFGATPAAADLSWLIFTAAAITVPAAALIAILRYRLYDIDRLIDRTFVYGALTAIVAGLYAASIRLFTSIFEGLSGQTSDAALVLTTLVLATSFTPIKGRLESIAGHRYRDPAVGTAAESADPPSALNEAAWDQRMEEIARRVSLESLAAQRSMPRPSPRVGQEADVQVTPGGPAKPPPA